MRARKKYWADNELEKNDLIVENGAESKGRWEQVFDNKNPVFVEIGCGKGGFIVETAKRNPNINFIGLEREKMIIISGARQIREANENGEKINNVRFVRFDATNLSEIFEIGEIGRIYLNFSDPWHRKRKWAKRRLTHRNFLDNYKKLLSGDKEIHMKTDNRILFEFSLNEFAAMGWGLQNISLDLHNSEFAADNVVTEYEAKFSAKGFPIFRLEASFPNKPALSEYGKFMGNNENN